MTRKRRSFTPEFKQEPACLVLDQGYSVTEASRSSDVGENALRRWVKQPSEERVGVTPKSKAPTLEQQRRQELKARYERLEREKSILKKANALSFLTSHFYSHSYTPRHRHPGVGLGERSHPGWAF